MTRLPICLLAAALVASASGAQPTTRPLANIDPARNVAVVNVAEFASLPDVGGQAARMMLLVDETGTKRLFVNDMRGAIYGVSYDGRAVTRYIDTDDSTWGVQVQSSGRERGMQSFAFHPQFGQSGAPGYGKFYTWTDSRNNQAPADFRPGGGTNTHHTVLFEWTARNAAAASYDGGPPREIMRFEQPFANHNGGMAAFNPLARPGSEDFGLLYLGIGDGGSGGDPINLAQNLSSGFGKIFRIDPLGRNSANGKYGIPASNPFVGGSRPGAAALPEIYAYGLRNPQGIGWDPANGSMYVADIGQNVVEEVSRATPGANLGWNVWEGSFRYAGRGGVDTSNARGDTSVTFPVVEYAHGDPSIQARAAVAGVHVIRSAAVPPLRNRAVFADLVSGEILHFDADSPPRGGTGGIGRVLLRSGGGEPRTLLQLIRDKNTQQGKPPASRADLRFGAAADGRLFLLNKADGTIRVLLP